MKDVTEELHPLIRRCCTPIQVAVADAVAYGHREAGYNPATADTVEIIYEHDDDGELTQLLIR